MTRQPNEGAVLQRPAAAPRNFRVLAPGTGLLEEWRAQGDDFGTFLGEFVSSFVTA
jgi:hypothetical protein